MDNPQFIADTAKSERERRATLLKAFEGAWSGKKFQFVAFKRAEVDSEFNGWLGYLQDAAAPELAPPGGDADKPSALALRVGMNAIADRNTSAKDKPALAPKPDPKPGPKPRPRSAKKPGSKKTSNEKKSK
jgi:hypothetical protein